MTSKRLAYTVKSLCILATFACSTSASILLFGGHLEVYLVPFAIIGVFGMTVSGLLATYGSHGLRFFFTGASSFIGRVEPNHLFAKIAETGSYYAKNSGLIITSVSLVHTCAFLDAGAEMIGRRLAAALNGILIGHCLSVFFFGHLQRVFRDATDAGRLNKPVSKWVKILFRTIRAVLLAALSLFVFGFALVEIDKNKKKASYFAAEKAEYEAVVREFIEYRSQFRKEGKAILDEEGHAMLLVPSGQFEMGPDDGSLNNPVRLVNVSDFFIGETEVTYGQWKSVLVWAKANGYDFDDMGEGESDKRPVTGVSWYDVVKWCNAKSEKEGLSRCYKVNGEVYRKGNEATVTCDWEATGYRLPTEAEREKAASGSLERMMFTIPYSLDEEGPPNKVGPTVMVGDHLADGYGLYDLVGNAWEWCWDWYAPYSGDVDPKGPESGSARVLRGGYWDGHANYARSANRISSTPTFASSNFGFRLARGRLQSGEGGSR